MLHVHANLMGAAGFQMNGEQAVPVFYFHHLIMGDGSVTFFKVYHTLDNRSLFSGNGGINRTLSRGGNTPFPLLKDIVNVNQFFQ